MLPSLPGWSGQLCYSKHCSILSALLPEPSVSSFKGAALSPQILPAFCVGCWCIGLAATLVWESFLETPMLILYGNLLDKMSNSGGRQLLSTLQQVLHFTSLLCTRGLAGKTALPLCAICSSEQLQQPASLQISGETSECSDKHPNLFSAGEMPWQGACWGALQDVWLDGATSLHHQARKERNQKWVQKVSRARQPLLPVPVREAPQQPMLPAAPDAELHWCLFPSSCSPEMSDGLPALPDGFVVAGHPKDTVLLKSFHIYGDSAGLPVAHHGWVSSIGWTWSWFLMWNLAHWCRGRRQAHSSFKNAFCDQFCPPPCKSW